LSPELGIPPETFWLTTNDLGVGCGQKWLKVEQVLEVVGIKPKFRGASGFRD
jgi:hypothetical protein